MTSEPPGVNEGPRSRMTVVVGVEWTMLMLRYVLYVFMAAFSVASDVSDLSRIIIVAGGSALAHNIFAHAVLYLRAYHLFLSPINFFIYLGRFCLLLAVTGGAASPFAPFLLFLLIAYHVYIPSGMNSFRATFVVCTFYAFTVLLVWVIDGMDWMHLPLYLNLGYIAFCGWLMYMMARVVIQLNHEALRPSIALQSSESTQIGRAHV